MVFNSPRTELWHLGPGKLRLHGRYSWGTPGYDQHRVGQREHRHALRLAARSSVSPRTGGAGSAPAQLHRVHRDEMRNHGGFEHFLLARSVQVLRHADPDVAEPAVTKTVHRPRHVIDGHVLEGD